MLRFAVHQPSQRRASPRSHGTPCRDVPRRVHISIAGIGAGDAAEESLALATLRSDMPTHRTTLTRERGIHSFHPASGPVLKAGGEHRPRGVQDRPIETCLLRHPAPRSINSAPCRADHARHPQILDPDHVILAGDARQPGLRSLTPTGPTPATRQCTCGRLDTKWQRRLVGGAIRQRQRDRDTTIDTDHRAVTGTSQGRRDYREGDMPTPGSIQRDAVGLPVRQGSAASQPDPTSLGNQDSRPAPVDLLHTQGLRADYPESLMTSLLAPGRPPMTTASPIRHRLREIPQRLLLHCVRTCSQPLVRGARIGQLLTLRPIVRETLAVIPIPELFHGEVPHEPGMCAMLREQHFLLRRRIQTKPHNRKVTVHPDNSGFPTIRKGGASTRESR